MSEVRGDVDGESPEGVERPDDKHEHHPTHQRQYGLASELLLR